jgi:DNA invertase Pin-like site-specific DNA recombinase
MKTFVTYLRVSTEKQGANGLGIEAQRTAVNGIIKSENGTLAAELIEVESGKKDRRPELAKAIQLCKQSGATLLIARLDRLSRNVRFLFEVKESGIDIKAADVPELNTLTLGMLAVLAQHERELIGKRTKAALAERRRIRGAWQTGKRKDGTLALNETARRKGIELRQADAAQNPNTIKAKALLAAVYGNGQSISLNEAASMLNAAGFVTPTGKAFNKQAVARLKP